MMEPIKETNIASEIVDSSEEIKKPQCSKKAGRVFRTVVVSVLVLFILLFGLYYVVPSPTKTVRNFFYALLNENYPKAYSYIAGDYQTQRGTLEEFAFEYDNAVRSGTRTRAIRITEEKKGTDSLHKTVIVEIDVLYQGSLVTSVGAYLCEKIPGQGWKIVGNVTKEYNASLPKTLVPKK